MATNPPRKPANRPSRRHDLIDAAVELFSLQTWEMATVARIVEHAGMTSAAFYYHFSSREELLEEVIENFAARWVERIESLLGSAQSVDDLSGVPAALLDDIDEHGQVARIFFLNTGSAPTLVDRCHREARRRLVGSAKAAVLRIDPDRDVALATVNGVAMVCLYEIAVRTYLSVDEPFRVLGPHRYRAQMGALGELTSGSPTTAA